MKTEKNIRIGKIAYCKIFDNLGQVKTNKYTFFQDEKAVYDCKRLFWRIYIITEITYH
jgi:hypothetical protein